MEKHTPREVIERLTRDRISENFICYIFDQQLIELDGLDLEALSDYHYQKKKEALRKLADTLHALVDACIEKGYKKAIASILHWSTCRTVDFRPLTSYIDPEKFIENPTYHRYLIEIVDQIALRNKDIPIEPWIRNRHWKIYPVLRGSIFEQPFELRKRFHKLENELNNLQSQLDKFIENHQTELAEEMTRKDIGLRELALKSFRRLNKNPLTDLKLFEAQNEIRIIDQTLEKMTNVGDRERLQGLRRRLVEIFFPSEMRFAMVLGSIVI